MDIWCFQITWYYPRASLACCNIHNPAGKIFSNETTVWSSLNVYLFVWGAGRGPGSFSAAERTPPLSLTTITTNVARGIPEAKLLICGSSLLFLSSLLPPNHSAQEKTNVWINFFSKNLPPSWVRGTKRSFMADTFALSSNATSTSFLTERKRRTKTKNKSKQHLLYAHSLLFMVTRI